MESAMPAILREVTVALRRLTVAGVAFLIAALPAWSQTLFSLPADATVDSGSDTVVCLSIDPLDEMIAADIDIAYDPAVLEAVLVQATPLLSGFSMTPNIQDPGWVRIALFGTQPLTGGGCAVEITFSALQPGCARLDLTRASINEGEVPSTMQDGMVEVAGIVDVDGDGWSESAGDCSDAFDWIYPGSAELCNGADDDCDGEYDEEVVCPCGGYVRPRDAEFWHRVCLGSSPEEAIQAAWVDPVNDTATFAAVGDVAALCAVMLAGGPEACVEAEREFMTLLLDVASSRLCGEQSIAASSSSAADVYAAQVEIDALLSDAGRDEADCLQATAVATEISGGTAIPEFLAEVPWLSVGKRFDESGSTPRFEAVALAWSLPDAAAAGRPTSWQLYGSTTSPPAWSVLATTGCHRYLLDFDRPAPGELVLYLVVGSTP
jgi:hypothetical protein